MRPTVCDRLRSSRSFSFTSLSVDEGLSQSTVNFILQVKEGFLLFATSDGLDRYDGVSVTVFTHNTSKDHFTTIPLGQARGGIGPFPQVAELLADREGWLYLGSTNGLVVLPADSSRVLPEGLNDLLVRASNWDQVYRLCEDREGVVWIGERLLAYHRKDGTVSAVAFPGPPARILALLEQRHHEPVSGCDAEAALRQRQHGLCRHGEQRDPALGKQRPHLDDRPVRDRDLLVRRPHIVRHINGLAAVGTDVFAGLGGNIGAFGDGVVHASLGDSSWTSASTGLPASSVVQALFTVGSSIASYSTFSFGMYRRTDLGASWKKVSTGLPYPGAGQNLFAAGNTIFTFTGTALDSMSSNDTSWTAVDNPGLPATYSVSAYVVVGSTKFITVLNGEVDPPLPRDQRDLETGSRAGHGRRRTLR